MALDIEATSNTLFGNIKKHQINVTVNEESKTQKMPSEEVNNSAPHQEIKENEESFNSSKLNLAILPASSTNKPKWQSLDKVTVLLSSEQKEGLDKIAKKIMKYRSEATKGNQDKERITANTLMRVLIDAFLDREHLLPMEVITSEESARKWIENLFVPHSGS